MKFQLGSPSWNFCDYIGSFIPGWKFKNLDFNENYFLIKWIFLSSWDETKVKIIWRKMMFHPRMKVSTRGQLAGMNLRLHVIVICFFMMKTITRWDEMSTRMRNNYFIPGNLISPLEICDKRSHQWRS